MPPFTDNNPTPVDKVLSCRPYHSPARSAIQEKAQASLRAEKFGRPVSQSDNAFAYDARGEVTNAVLDGAAYRYAYDHIGNRTSANEDGRSIVYRSNAVNQYTNLTSNLSPPTSNLSYDLDGNLVDDGERAYEWSAADRLFSVVGDTFRLDAHYDWRGRRVGREIDMDDGHGLCFAEDRAFVYDDWNLIHEYRYDYDADVETELEYFWGPALSGSLQGAGGVGGLVAVSIDGDFYFPGYDNNGNVIGYWNEDGEIVAEYAYDAFGNTIYEDGDMADVFPHRFSTKYYDAETDLYYYGYRYYSPSLGRWISRDPIEEKGGLNLVSFCENDSISRFDPLGKNIYLIEGTGTTGFCRLIPIIKTYALPSGMTIFQDSADWLVSPLFQPLRFVHFRQKRHGLDGSPPLLRFWAMSASSMSKRPQISKNFGQSQKQLRQNGRIGHG